MVNKQDNHKHIYNQRSYAQLFMGKDGDRPRYVLLRKCKCGDKYAYDLVAEKPQKVVA